ncbi:MAG TPA: VCBS repeat-containing protein [Catenuloplanes sp.]
MLRKSATAGLAAAILAVIGGAVPARAAVDLGIGYSAPSGDFNGDGLDDVVSFDRSNGTVEVQLNLAGSFGNGGRWSDHFAYGDQLPLVGDFNGDDVSDIITFDRHSGGAMVALSAGASFLPKREWMTTFAFSTEVPAIGDFNGDGRDDVALFTRGSDAAVWVMLSTGSELALAGRWHSHFAVGSELPAVGDFNGDGLDDIVTFTRGTRADAYVSFSNGGRFVEDNWKWHTSLAVGDELPAVGDFNGDGRDDIITFSRTAGSAQVSLSDGRRFAHPRIWHNNFARGTAIPGVGNFERDSGTFADIVAFTRDPRGDVLVAYNSGGGGFSAMQRWHDFFCATGTEVPAPGVVW